MALRCPILSSEYTGPNSCAVCRKDIARKREYECPRKLDRWVVAETCFNITRLTHKSRAQMEEIILPKQGSAISGDGTPDPVPVPVLIPAGG